jgi:tetratricopeptide (TPR) repeat protein
MTADEAADEAAERVYIALQQGDFSSALDSVEHALSLIENRPLLRARLLAWQGQAFFGLHQLEQAQQSVLRGLSLARKAKDTPGVEALRRLHREIVAGLAMRQRPLDATDSWISQSCIAFDEGQNKRGVELALKALSEADTPRDQVIALLALARSPEQVQGAVFRAHQIAQSSEDFNLINAVAKAARAAKIILSPHVF